MSAGDRMDHIGTVCKQQGQEMEMRRCCLTGEAVEHEECLECGGCEIGILRCEVCGDECLEAYEDEDHDVICEDCLRSLHKKRC